LLRQEPILARAQKRVKKDSSIEVTSDPCINSLARRSSNKNPYERSCRVMHNSPPHPHVYLAASCTAQVHFARGYLCNRQPFARNAICQKAAAPVSATARSARGRSTSASVLTACITVRIAAKPAKSRWQTAIAAAATASPEHIAIWSAPECCRLSVYRRCPGPQRRPTPVILSAAKDLNR
jgi:hypothetical protein